MKELDELAKRQWGLLTHEQALSFVTRHQLGRMIRQHILIPVHHGLYRMAGTPETWQQQIAAVLMVLPHGVASHFSAARLHGLRVAYGNEVHVTLPKKQRSSREGIRTHRGDILDGDVVVQQRISCTSVEKTIIDLASELARRQLAFMIDEAVVAGKTSFQAIAAVADAYNSRGRKGMKNLRALLGDRLPLADGFDRSIELKVLKAAQHAEVQQPVTQLRVLTKYGPYFIDAAWPDCLVGAEADGYTVHTASRIRHTVDRRRRNELETLGWRILNFTHDMSIDEVAAVLRNNVPTVGR